MRKNQFLYLYILYGCLAFSLFGCAKGATTANIRETKSTVIPISEALDNLDHMMSQLEMPTTKTSSCVASILSFGGKSIKTKGLSDNYNLPDTLLYLVNFDKNGYAVLSADNRIGNVVYCITEDGSIDIDDLDEVLKTRTEYDNNVLACDSTDVFDSMGPSFVHTLLIYNALRDFNRCGDEGGGENSDDTDEDDNPLPYPEDDISGPTSDITVKPMVKTRWGQSFTPFNTLTPHNFPAGCVCIAVAQILVANKYATNMLFDGTVCNWDDMESVYNCNDPNNYYSTWDANNQVSHFVYELGKSGYCNISYGAKESSGYDSDARDTFRKLGYTNVHRFWHPLELTSDNKDRIFRMLHRGLSVYISASRWKSRGIDKEGHAWIIDGFTRGTTMNDCAYYYYHCNWGWGGTSNGYFKVECFDTEKRDRIEEGIDDGTAITQQKLHYDFNYTIIDYHKPDEE